MRIIEVPFHVRLFIHFIVEFEGNDTLTGS